MCSGLLNRTGASLGIRAFRTEWSCLQGVCVLFGTGLWVVLSFDMMAAVAGLVFAISFGVDCAIWTESVITLKDKSICPSAWVLFGQVVPLAVISVVLLPALLHAIVKYWSRTFGIAAGLIAWGLALWYGNYGVWDALPPEWIKSIPNNGGSQLHFPLVALFVVNVWGILTAISNRCRGHAYSCALQPPLFHRMVVNNMTIALIGFNGAAMLIVLLLVAPKQDPNTCNESVNHDCQDFLLLCSGIVRAGFFSVSFLQLAIAYCRGRRAASPQQKSWVSRPARLCV